MPLPEVAVSALLLQDRVSNENGPDSGFYYWLCSLQLLGPLVTVTARQAGG